MQLQAFCGAPVASKSNDEIQLAWANLIRTGTNVLQRVEDDLKREGLPPVAWYDVLWELDKAPDGILQQSEVQTRVLLAQYNFVRLLDRLERAGLIRRMPCKRDGRSNVLHLTEAGRDLRRRMWPAYDAAIAAHVGRHLERAEAAALAQLLSKLLPDHRSLSTRTRQSGLEAKT